MSYIKGTYTFTEDYASTNPARYQVPQDIPVEHLTHLFVAFFQVNPSTGSIDKTAKTWLQYQLYKQDIHNLRIRNPKLKLIASLFGYANSVYKDPVTGVISYPANTVITNPSLRSIFLNEINDLINIPGESFDGVDIDFEAWPELTKDVYPQFVREARAKFTGKFLSICIGYDETRYLNPNVFSHVDCVNLMAYVFTGGFSTYCDYFSNLYVPTNGKTVRGIDSLVNTLASMGVPRNKINLGIAYYTRQFTNTDGLGNGYAAVSDKLYRELDPNILDNAKIDYAAGSASVYNVQARTYMPVDNKTTIQMKINYVKKNGMMGMFSWRASLDYPATEQYCITKFIYYNLN